MKSRRETIAHAARPIRGAMRNGPDEPHGEIMLSHSIALGTRTGSRKLQVNRDAKERRRRTSVALPHRRGGQRPKRHYGTYKRPKAQRALQSTLRHIRQEERDHAPSDTEFKTTLHPNASRENRSASREAFHAPQEDGRRETKGNGGVIGRGPGLFANSFARIRFDIRKSHVCRSGKTLDSLLGQNRAAPHSPDVRPGLLWSGGARSRRTEAPAAPMGFYMERPSLPLRPLPVTPAHRSNRSPSGGFLRKKAGRAYADDGSAETPSVRGGF